MKDVKNFLGTLAIASAATAIFLGAMYLGLRNRVRVLENNSNNNHDNDLY